MEKPKILYAEDDETLSFVTKDNLEINGFSVTHCMDGEEAIEAFSKNTFDLCILDVMMPKKDGFTVATEIRKKNAEIPILFLTAKSLKDDKITGLKLGADDYITKPFSIEELVLKIGIFLKRKNINQIKQDHMNIGSLSFDYRNLSIIGPSGVEKILTQREADLLKILFENKNNIIKREEILEKVWGQNDYFLGRSMDVFISRLRKYLVEDPSVKIDNIHGVGFKMNINS